MWDFLHISKTLHLSENVLLIIKHISHKFMVTAGQLAVVVTELSVRQGRKVQLPCSESVILALHVSFSAESSSHGLLSVPPWQIPIGWFAWKSIRIQGNGELQLLFTRMLRPWLSHPDPFLPSVYLSLSFLTLSLSFCPVDVKSLDQVSVLTRSCWFFVFFS